jgi:hypothetical protein
MSREHEFDERSHHALDDNDGREFEDVDTYYQSKQFYLAIYINYAKQNERDRASLAR